MMITKVNNNKKEDNSKKRFKKNESIFVFCLIILPFVQWLVFWLYVNFQTIGLAFQDPRTGMLTIDNFNNFWVSLTKGGDIFIAIKNTFKYFFVNLFVILPISIIVSFFLFKKILGYRLFRFVFYIPSIITGVALVAVFKKFIDPSGPLNDIAKLFGTSIPQEGLLASSKTATGTMIAFNIWTGICGSMLFYYGAMARVPTDVLEAAKLDGCGPMREIVSIILPLIWPTVSTQIIFAFTGIFGASGPILLFTNGQYDTTTISFWIFEQVYGTGAVGGSGSYNLVSAAGLCFTAIGVPIVLTGRKILEKIPSVEY